MGTTDVARMAELEQRAEARRSASSAKIRNNSVELATCAVEQVGGTGARVHQRGGRVQYVSASITADDPVEMVALGTYVLSQFGPFGGGRGFPH